MKPLATLILALALSAAGQTTLPTTQPGKVKWVGVYSQPIESFDKWKAMGVNLLVHSELKNGTVKQADWRAGARARDLHYIDTYLSDDDVNDDHLLGWVVKDSDEWNRARGNPPVRPAVAPFIAEAQRLAALNVAKGTSKWIFANADGPSVTTALWEKPPYPGIVNGEKALLPYLTARSMDWYPRVSTASTQPSEVARRPLYLPAQATWRLKTWSDQIGAQPAAYIAIVEAAKGWNSPLGVTGDEMRETVDYLMGVRPFPVPDANAKPINVQYRAADVVVFWTANGQSGPGWKWDVMTDDERAALIDITARIKDTGMMPVPTTLPTTLPVPSTLPTTQPDPIATLAAKVDAQAAEIVAMKATVGTLNATLDRWRQAIAGPVPTTQP